MNVIVTGGAGFLGSHIVVELLDEGHDVLILDDLSNSQLSVIESIRQITPKPFEFLQVDVTDFLATQKALGSVQYDGIIHLAGFKSISESLSEPLSYYHNNLVSTINLLRLAKEKNIPRFVFSSSATVYGNGRSPFQETDDLLPTLNPYGETKAMCERIITDHSTTEPNGRYTLLRYFNPVGAHTSGLIGENSFGTPTNIMPIILQVAAGERPNLQVFGSDYDTPDGTGIRDYIHVVDLAKAHVAALIHAEHQLNVYNVGTGNGVSVLELVSAFEQVNRIKIPYDVVARRVGDIPVCYADVQKIYKELGWSAKLGLEDMVRDAWAFKQRQCEELV